MDRISFKVNGFEHSVGCEVNSRVMLVDYLRYNLELRGTKYMCREAGCGACIVSAVKCQGGPTVAVNSCMVSITSCQDWEITTIEELGNRKKGYHPLQETLAKYNGTQCGYCTPAWIMAMYSLIQSKKDLTMLEIEQSFGSNVCRCTGYRPILEAFKKFGKDAPKNEKIMDIEDLYICKKTGLNCDKINCEEDDWCIVSNDDLESDTIIKIKLQDDKYWYRVCKISDIFVILDEKGYDSYMLVYGNTAKGAYPINEYPHILIDISSVAELRVSQMDQNLIIGAGLTLTEVLDTFETASKQQYFGYLQKFYDHIKLVAHIAVRNLASIGGNLMIKHQHNDFPSDIFLLFETVGAQMTLLCSKGVRKTLTMQDFLKEDMKGKVIVNFLIPPLSDTYKLEVFKIMPRSQNAHAIVNAGFLFKLTKDNAVQEARVVYGGLSTSFIRASATESYLVGKSLFTNETLQSAIKVLENELNVTENLPEPSVTYRKHLALALFYKGLLSLCPKSSLNQRYQSGAIKLHETRPVSTAKQIFDTDPSLWPLNQPISKIEALIQCAGEAKFADDLPTYPREIYASFVLSTVPLGDIDIIDSNSALNLKGVIAFYTAADIPGLNSFTPDGALFYVANEEILCSGAVKYFNQPLAIIVAKTQNTADAAAKLVKVTYKNVKKPVLDIKITKNDPNRITLNTSMDATERGKDVTKVIKGSNTIYGQYHFMMENLTCVTRPTEEGLEVYTAGQWMDATQVMISKALNIDANRIDVYIRRIGGAYGMKISRSIQVAVACSLVVQKLNRPCRMVQLLTTTTRAVGKRLPCHTDFEVGVNRSGVIQCMDYNLYEDNGYKVNETLTELGIDMFNNCYDSTKWNYKCYDATTDTAKNTWCRSPGSLENIAMAEYVVEQISYELSLDPVDVRLANLNTTKYNDLKEMVETLKTNSQYNERRAAVNKFNADNRWKKRGLRFAFLRWTTIKGAITLDVNMAVFHGDGTVVITHGGIEMGQGVNTKAVQICAYFLKIPIDKIQIKANNTIFAPNCFISGGSLTGQDVSVGVQICCEELLERLKPLRSQMNNPTWAELIKKAFKSGVDLQTHGYVGSNAVQNYDIFGVTLAESEVDILTGEFEILRVDILQDVGQSVSPEIDIGQVEGAFIMGLGYWTSEKLVYDPNTGELLTDRTWNYYVPLARDIPQDFRVYFRKKSYSIDLFLGAKATGEPPICMSIVIAFAIREAIAAARQESGIPTTDWFQIDGPYTVENIALAAATDLEEFKFN